MSDEREIDPALEQVVGEARDLLEPKLTGSEPDWDRMEEALMRRVEAEQQVARLGGSRGLWGGAAAALALAAAAVLVVGRAPSSASLDAPIAQAPAAHEVGTLAARQGGGEIRVNGAMVPTGQSLRVGDAVEVRGATAIFDRPGKVTFAVEDAQLPSVRETHQSKAVVKSDAVPNGPLVLALEHGAIEADVVPVAQGEAFAVDVGELRVAVHGTHLRVARAGAHVVVDLTEGVISVGRPPRTGSTYGTLVVAPAHVELDLDDVAAPLKIDHAKDSVRTANPIRELVGGAPRVAAATTVSPGSVTTAPAAVARASAPAKKDDHKPEAAPGAIPVDPHPQESIVAAVKQCERQSRPLPSGVSVTVSSQLSLKIGEDGIPESARFEPPLSPDVQSCAATTIYKTRFEKPGSVQISIELQK